MFVRSTLLFTEAVHSESSHVVVSRFLSVSHTAIVTENVGANPVLMTNVSPRNKDNFRTK